MSIYDDLGFLRLYYLKEHFDQFISSAGAENLSPKEVVSKLVDLEVIEKRNRSTQQRIRTAKLGNFRQMAEFDYDWPKSINRAAIDELLTSEFIGNKSNVVLAGPGGVGKTMIAKNIGWQAVLNGYRVIFTTASDLVIDLGSQESTAARQRRVKKYMHPHLLIIDELGYLSFDNQAADLIFEIVAKRYENASIIVTTNLSFRDWTKVFPGAACVSALIDRLTHHCEIMDTFI